MARPDIRARLARPEPFLFGWCALPGVLHADAMARLPFEGACLDMQHGLMGFSDMVAMVPAINNAGRTAIVRVAWNEPALVGQALDAGAGVVIAPMISTVAEAEQLVRAAKYPPLGLRSWGAYAGLHHSGLTRDQYLAQANSLAVTFAMIETQEALDNLDRIAATEGLDGLFVGPSDLSISLSGGASIDPLSAPMRQALTRIAEAARRHGLVAGIYGVSGAFSRHCVEQGFRFISSPSDASMMQVGAKAFLDEATSGSA